LSGNSVFGKCMISMMMVASLHLAVLKHVFVPVELADSSNLKITIEDTAPTINVFASVFYFRRCHNVIVRNANYHAIIKRDVTLIFHDYRCVPIPLLSRRFVHRTAGATIPYRQTSGFGVFTARQATIRTERRLGDLVKSSHRVVLVGWTCHGHLVRLADHYPTSDVE